MSTHTSLFTPFKTSIKAYALPRRFTFPFYYEPHPLCSLAAKELQDHLMNQNAWKHNFGLKNEEDSGLGKMFGVLLVRNKENNIGYLSAFSGKLAGANHHPMFVPPVYDMLQEKGFYKKGEDILNQLSAKIGELTKNPEIGALQNLLKAEINLSEMAIHDYRKQIIENRKIRKQKRVLGEKELEKNAFEKLNNDLAKQSIAEKNELKKKMAYWEKRTMSVQTQLDELLSVIERLKNLRKKTSNDLQQKLFDQYHFLNRNGKKKGLIEIFKNTSQGVPPAAAGECALPKLLQYAFSHQLEPMAFAEFWWGCPPKSALRKHKQFYPACQGKCQPILKHMLAGMDVDDNPLLSNQAEGKNLKVIHEDEDLLIINKPAELLSVPGKTINDSVYSRVKLRFPDAKGPIIVHRLDMSTSGLMMLAKTKEAHAYLQRQFIKRSIKKRYVALLDGLITKDTGMIELPLRLDIDDRPRQLVCHKHGKPAKTKWEVVARDKYQTKIHFYPITGRTHQLRVHAAHPKGLNTPILGDDLYGNKSKRLHLHAETLEFRHPRTKQLVKFKVEADF